MTHISDLAKQLEIEQLTLIIENQGRFYKSQKRGIAPLLEVQETEPEFMRSGNAADKVVGKSAAMLYLKGGITQLHAGIISEPALAVLQSHGVEVEYVKLVPYIINRTGDGRCPMESLVLDVEEPDTAYQMLKLAVQKMNQPK